MEKYRQQAIIDLTKLVETYLRLKRTFSSLMMMNPGLALLILYAAQSFGESRRCAKG